MSIARLNRKRHDEQEGIDVDQYLVGNHLVCMPMRKTAPIRKCKSFRLISDMHTKHPPAVQPAQNLIYAIRTDAAGFGVYPGVPGLYDPSAR
jgi:hypothetical protein